MQTTDAEEMDLEQKTLAYWGMSRLVHAGIGRQMTTQNALILSLQLVEFLGPQRVLKQHATTLYWYLVEGPKKKKTNKPINNISTLPSKLAK